MQLCKESALANHAVIAAIFQQLCAADCQRLARILWHLIDILQADSP